VQSLEPFFDSFDADFVTMRRVVRQILQEEDELMEIVQLVGRDSLAEQDKLKLDVARIIREDYLQQDGYTEYDNTCPFYKTVGMMRNIVHYYTTAGEALARSTAEHRITWAKLKSSTHDVLYALTQMKYIMPDLPEHEVIAKLASLHQEISTAFVNVED
jgi:V-type H+-transporting ATPase subunit A